MRRGLLTLIGLTLVGVAAITVGKAFYGPAREQREARQKVLTGNYEPRLDGCKVLQDDELPDGIAPPKVGVQFVYLEVSVLYPGAPAAPKGTFTLAHVNGSGAPVQSAMYRRDEHEARGTVVHLVFRISPNFEYAKLYLGRDVVLPRVDLD